MGTVPFTWAESLIEGVRGGLTLLAVVTLIFGAWSAIRPGRSIALYQDIMRVFNWRVEPINQPRELLTTRWFGWKRHAAS